MWYWLDLVGWLACVLYSTVPSFWLMIHPFADRWRARHAAGEPSPYRFLLPAWFAMWIVVALATRPFRFVVLYRLPVMWVPAASLLAAGLYLYAASSRSFSAKQLGGIPELHGGHPEQRLVTSGIRARVRHPVYLAHLCEMVAWSLGTGLVVCWGLTAFAVVTGALMIQKEDAELETRFGDAFRKYRDRVPAMLPSSVRPPSAVRSLKSDGVSIRYESQGTRVWQLTIADLACIGEYTNENGPWLDDYFLVFGTHNGLWHEASFYADGCGETITAIGKTLRFPLNLGLAHSTTFASRIIWPQNLEGQSLFVGKAINPLLQRLPKAQQL